MRSWAALEAERLIGKGQVIINKVPQFPGVVGRA